MLWREREKIRAAVFLSAVLFSLPARAETVLPPVLVTADKQERPLDAVAASATVISREEIESRQARTVPEVLRSAAGVDVISSGSLGDDTDVRLRGADRDEVLILIDGVPVNNVSEGRAAFLSAIPLENVERIEIVRGSQGVLYGSDAVGGVINIITRKGSETPTFSASFEGGNLETFRETVDGAFQAGKFRFSGGASRTDQGGRFDRDRFGETAVSANFGYRFLPEIEVAAGVNYLRSDQELFYEFQSSFDPATGSILVKIDPDNDSRFHSDKVITHLSVKGAPRPWWNAELHYGLFLDLEDLENTSAGDTADPGFFPGDQDFSGRGLRNTLDLRNFFSAYESPAFSTQVTAGFEFEDERLHFTDFGGVEFPAPGQEGARQNYAPYVQQNFRFFEEKLILTGGVRYDSNTTFGHEWSPAASVLVKIPGTKTTLRGSYGEGFHAPTVLEFFDQVLLRETNDPFFQAVRLEAELSQSYEAGVEQKVGDWAELSATFFYIDYDRLFDGLQFIRDAYSTGVEIGASVKPFRWLKAGGNYTFLRAIDEATGLRLADRPRHRGALFVQAEPTDRLTVRADVNIVGNRTVPSVISTSGGDLNVLFIDPDGQTSASGTVPGYVKVDLAASYEIFRDRLAMKSGRVYVKLENLLDDRYEEKFGFPAPGITFLAGAKASF
ncbi:MAG TPA: TonB-dependent receptor [bacterium]|nr:TonB-dependent receptor [bacterium]